MGVLNRRKLCKCGCGMVVKPGNTYINHHARIGRHNSKEMRRNISLGHGGTGILKELVSIECLCGCGQLTTKGHRFISGHSARVSSEETREKQRQAVLGRPVSEVTREKLRVANTGKKRSAEIRQQLSLSRLGQVHSEESIKRQVISLSKFYDDPENRERQSKIMKEVNRLNPSIGQRMSERRKGAGSAFYIDGRCSGDNYSYSEDFKERLKELVRDRDGRQCQLCFVDEKETKKKLDVHHINYDRKNSELSNLISLCHPCHSKTNCNRDKWISLFQTPQRLTLISGGIV